MTAKPTLRAVDTAADAVVDIAALNRADVLRRDWSAVLIAGDRAKPLVLADGPKRTWAR